MSKKANIQLFEEKKVRTVWDEDKEEWYFSIQDVVEILTDSKDVKQYIKKLLSRDEQLKINWGTICTLVEMVAADGKKRKIQASNLQGIFRLIQSIPSPKADLNMLAELSTKNISEASNPETFDEHAQIAVQGGEIARNARQELEHKTGKPAISPLNAKSGKTIGKGDDDEI